MAYQLKIITPNGQVFDEEVESLTASGTEGSFGIYSQHASFITSLKLGVLSVKSSAEEIYFALNGGILEVGDDHNVLILSNHVVLKKDKEKALKESEFLADAMS